MTVTWKIQTILVIIAEEKTNAHPVEQIPHQDPWS